MIILALDTSTAGSVAVLDDSTMLVERAGRPELPHATRLPGDLLDALSAASRALDDVSLLAVASGPGAFTGLRIGIATMQGLAFARGVPLVGVSALDALADASMLVSRRGDTHDVAAPREAAGAAVGAPREAPLPGKAGSGERRPPDRVPAGPKAHHVLACMDAARGEVFATLYGAAEGSPALIAGPLVGGIDRLLELWSSIVADGEIVAIGDGAIRYGHAIQRWRSDAHIVEPTPLLARWIGLRARDAFATGAPVLPHAIQPLYVRRPDAELARDRAAAQVSR